MNPYQHSFGGNIPQDVAGKQGENVIFIVYTLKDLSSTYKCNFLGADNKQ